MDEPEIRAEMDKFDGGSFDEDEWPPLKGTVANEVFHPLIASFFNSITKGLELVYDRVMKEQLRRLGLSGSDSRVRQSSP